jgi:hypothetical protein
MNTTPNFSQYLISAIACITVLFLNGCETVYKRDPVSIEETSVNVDFERGVAQYKGEVRKLRKQQFPTEASGVIAILSVKNSSGNKINASQIKVLVKKENPVQVWVDIDGTSYCYEVDLVAGVWTIVGSC